MAGWRYMATRKGRFGSSAGNVKYKRDIEKEREERGHEKGGLNNIGKRRIRETIIITTRLN